ncbi:MAG: ferredoxin [Nocardioidaceae bacterium]|nr:ferredoxin [Nocardioidaceae bacterium]
MSGDRGGASRAGREAHLRVDWQACQGRGLCHEVLPELISLDDWGYPVIADAVPAGLLAQAGRAVRSCPQLALTLVVATEAARRA